MEGIENDYYPYCSNCTACGEEGCCSHIQCISYLTSTHGCKYGRRYLEEVLENRAIVKLIYRLMDRSKKKDGYSNEDFRNDFERFSERILRDR